jgi:metallo-beta-lactamase class B
MKLANIRAAITLIVLLALGTGESFAQQTPIKRNFEAEINAELQAAKTAAGFEFLGTLVRTCLLPQSGGENLTDVAPAYITDPSKAPPRDTWFAEPTKVFDNLYFVGGKLHSSWALTTKDGIILIDTIYPYNSEELIIEGMKKVGLDPAQIRYLLISHAHGDHIGAPKCYRSAMAPASSWVVRIGTGSKNIRPATRPWRPNATSSQLTA